MCKSVDVSPIADSLKRVADELRVLNSLLPEHLSVELFTVLKEDRSLDSLLGYPVSSFSLSALSSFIAYFDFKSINELSSFSDIKFIKSRYTPIGLYSLKDIKSCKEG